MSPICSGATVALAAMLLAASPYAAAQITEPQPIRGDIRDLAVGVAAADFPREGYFAFACGSNGGPPLVPLDGWEDFARCSPEPNGLYEVYVEYDAEGQIMLQMLTEALDAGEEILPRHRLGTRVAGRPVVLSVLFGADGISEVVRAVTDSRVEFEERRNAYLLRVPVMGTFGREGWECVDLPLGKGETPVGQFVVKARCEKDVFTGRHVITEAHLYRRAGQTGFDRAGIMVEGDFWSEGRVEFWDPETYAAVGRAE